MSTLIKSSQSITGTASDRVEELKALIESISLIDYHEAGDVLFYDTVNNKKVFASADSDFANDYPASQYSPIGVVAIPTSHNVYGNNKCGVMSIVPMSYSTPDTGGSSEQGIYWGQYGVDTSLTNYTQVVYHTLSSQGQISTTGYTSISSSTCLPSDNFSNTVCPTDPSAFWYTSSNIYFVPSPYLNDGSFNSVYSQGGSSNVLSDFDGKTNTSTLLELATAQSDWKTADTITNNSGEGYSPAACCCWRYHTDGTSQGDWYLPSMGELGYMMVRLKTINNSISTLSSVYGVGLAVSTSNTYWSSSEYSSNTAVLLNTYNGNVHNYNKYNNYYVRAFCRL